MFKEIKRINGSNSAWLKYMAGNILYSLEEGATTYINDKSSNRYLSLLNFSVFKEGLYFFEDSILYKIEEGNWVRKFKIEDVDRLKIIGEDVLFGWKQLSRREYQYTFYDFDCNLLWSYSGNESIKPSEGIVFYGKRFDDTKISVRDLKTGFPLWHYTLPEGFFISGKPQLVEDVLFFTAYNKNRKNQLMTGLYLETGKVLWQNIYEVTHFTKFIIAHVLNEKNNMLYGYGNWYQVFNPKTGELVFERDKEPGLEPYKNSIYANKLWFVSGRGEKAKFGALDIETSEIDFVQDCPLENDEQFDKPIYHKGKLYLLDSKGTLRIYEQQ